MNKYEFNDKTVLVPTGWDDLTVGTYDKMWHLKPKTPRERANIVAIACGVDLQVFLDEPTEVFNAVMHDVAFLFEDNPQPPVPHVIVGSDKYNVAIENKLSFGEYIDVDDVQKNSDAILSNVLAIVCRPAGEKYNPDNNDDRAAMFAALPVSQVQGVLAFFLLNWQLSTRRTQLFANLREMVDQLPPNIGALLKNGASIRLYRIWQIMKYCALMMLLRARLRKYSHSYSIKGTKAPRKLRKRALTANGTK